MSPQIQIAPELNETAMLGRVAHQMCSNSLSLRGRLFSICNYTKQWEKCNGDEILCEHCIEVEESGNCLVCGSNCFG